MRSRGRTVAVLVVLAIVVVAVALTRGGDEGGTTMTHAQLVERVNAACARLARENGALEAPPKPYDDQSAPFFTAVDENVRTVRDELDALSPPEEDGDALDRLVDVYERIGVDLEQLQSAASVEQAGEIETVIAEVEQTAREGVEIERELGVCPGKSSVRFAVGAQLRRSRPNPLTETGPLG